MNNSDKFILFSIIVIIGLLIIWGVSFQKDYLLNSIPMQVKNKRQTGLRQKQKNILKTICTIMKNI